MQPHIHILGICGTFMGGLALLARELGFRVSGSDRDVYPPMSDQLAAAGIDLGEGYDPAQIEPAPDEVVVGNALSRGNPAVEYLLDAGIPYSSGAEWLARNVLRGRHVLAVSGTHGKTTTSSILAYLLDRAGLEPGFLIGGVPLDFDQSARLGGGRYFVIEADEYDTAFFDKRSKFVHYRPRTLVINNIEFDHADIFPDLAAIQRQFHHLVRCVPGAGALLHFSGSPVVEQTLALGCWTPRRVLGVGDTVSEADWHARAVARDASKFEVRAPDGSEVTIRWHHPGHHNLCNALAAIAAASEVGVPPTQSAQALGAFRGVRRRLELLGEVDGVRVYDDFAHHPTAIAATLAALRASGDGRIVALIEPRSNTMRAGAHREALVQAVAAADHCFWYEPPGLDWSLEAWVMNGSKPSRVIEDLDALVTAVALTVRPGDRVVIMSNGSFGGVHGLLLAELRRRSISP